MTPEEVDIRELLEPRTQSAILTVEWPQWLCQLRKIADQSAVNDFESSTALPDHFRHSSDPLSEADVALMMITDNHSQTTCSVSHMLMELSTRSHASMSLCLT